jgi:hypothetical protein
MISDIAVLTDQPPLFGTAESDERWILSNGDWGPMGQDSTVKAIALAS